MSLAISRVASTSKRHGASRRQSSGLVFEESLDVEGGEHHDGAAPLLPGERMEEEETREEDGEELTRRHDGEIGRASCRERV